MLENANILAPPGSGFGKFGGYVRFSISRPRKTEGSTAQDENWTGAKRPCLTKKVPGASLFSGRIFGFFLNFRISGEKAAAPFGISRYRRQPSARLYTSPAASPALLFPLSARRCPRRPRRKPSFPAERPGALNSRPPGSSPRQRHQGRSISRWLVSLHPPGRAARLNIPAAPSPLPGCSPGYGNRGPARKPRRGRRSLSPPYP